MKYLSVILIFVLSLVSTKAQDVVMPKISITIETAEYRANDQFINLILTIKNNTDSILYIINPKAYYFDKHAYPYNMNEHGLFNPPYSLMITTNKKCTKKIDAMIMIEANQVSQTKLINDLVKLNPSEEKTFNRIGIHRKDYLFCAKREYQIQIKYKPDFYIIKEKDIEKINKKYNTIVSETAELDKIIRYDLETKEWLSTTKDNFEKLNKIILQIPIMTKLSGEEFISNTIIANEIN